MRKKIIFLDIDGTLTVSGSNVPPESALKAIKLTQEQGNLVFLCTGRNYGMLSPLLKYGFDGYIGSSGGYVACGDNVIYDCPMTDEQMTKAMNVLKNNGVYRTIESRDGAYTDESFKEFIKSKAQTSGNSEFLRWREQLENSLSIKRMSEYDNQPVYKIVIMSPGIKNLKEPMEVLQDEFNFCIQEPGQLGIINGEVVNRKFDKGKGVEKVCEYLGIPLGDTYGFGDSMNDIELLETTGVSVCMANGSEALKKKANYICRSVEDDGIYKAFERFELF